jgi:tetratricopeptide (TPR) repeat protein
MPTSESQVHVGRRYLERGFLDAALKLFARNAEFVRGEDWSGLAERLMDRNRVQDVVRVCELGAVPLPREHLLARGDALMLRKDVDRAMRFYELADADQERWTRLVDTMTALPGRERQVVEVAARRLRSAPPMDQSKGRRLMKAVK